MIGYVLIIYVNISLKQLGAKLFYKNGTPNFLVPTNIKKATRTFYNICYNIKFK